MNSNNYKSLLDEIEEEHKQSTEKSLDKNSRVLIIDGLNTFIRAFSANPSINDDGVHVGGIIGFLKSIRYAISKLKPTRCIIVFDGKNGTKKRKKLYPEYKSQRKVRHRFNRNVDWSTSPVDEEYSMKMQLSRLIKYLDQLPISILSIDNVEADDVIAYISTTVLKNEKIKSIKYKWFFKQAFFTNLQKTWKIDQKKGGGLYFYYLIHLIYNLTTLFNKIKIINLTKTSNNKYKLVDYLSVRLLCGNKIPCEIDISNNSNNNIHYLKIMTKNNIIELISKSKNWTNGFVIKKNMKKYETWKF